jgi:hypothetical protein
MGASPMRAAHGMDRWYFADISNRNSGNDARQIQELRFLLM